jgi:outer membrane protein OmpA-like peptidoglycan-associated protein
MVSSEGLHEKTIRLREEVHFAKGARNLDATARAVVKEVAELLRLNPQVKKLTVEGNASNDEPRAAELAKARADAVVAELVRLKVDPERLVPYSYGDTKPVADNTTPEGRERNRRVVFVVAELETRPP